MSFQNIMLVNYWDPTSKNPKLVFQLICLLDDLVAVSFLEMFLNPNSCDIFF